MSAILKPFFGKNSCKLTGSYQCPPPNNVRSKQIGDNACSKLKQERIAKHGLMANFSTPNGPSHNMCIARSHLREYLATEWTKSSGLEDVLQTIGRSLDSTGHPVEFYWIPTRILQVCFKCLRLLEWPISLRNVIKISTGRPVECLLDVH